KSATRNPARRKSAGTAIFCSANRLPHVLEIRNRSLISLVSRVLMFPNARLSLCLHVVTEQRILIANVELAVGNHGMRPSWFVRAAGLIESPALNVFLAIGFN